jgi:hypothetical protein
MNNRKENKTVVLSGLRRSENKPRNRQSEPVSLLALRVLWLHFHAAKRPNWNTRVITAPY